MSRKTEMQGAKSQADVWGQLIIENDRLREREYKERRFTNRHVILIDAPAATGTGSWVRVRK